MWYFPICHYFLLFVTQMYSGTFTHHVKPVLSMPQIEKLFGLLGYQFSSSRHEQLRLQSLRVLPASFGDLLRLSCAFFLARCECRLLLTSLGKYVGEAQWELSVVRERQRGNSLQVCLPHVYKSVHQSVMGWGASTSFLEMGCFSSFPQLSWWVSQVILVFIFQIVAHINNRMPSYNRQEPVLCVSGCMGLFCSSLVICMWCNQNKRNEWLFIMGGLCQIRGCRFINIFVMLPSDGCRDFMDWTVIIKRQCKKFASLHHHNVFEMAMRLLQD